MESEGPSCTNKGDSRYYVVRHDRTLTRLVVAFVNQNVFPKMEDCFSHYLVFAKFVSIAQRHRYYCTQLFSDVVWTTDNVRVFS